MLRKFIYTLIIAAAGSAAASAAGLSFKGTKVAEVKPDASTGLNNIYVVESAEGATASFKASNSSAKVTWYIFGAMGGAYAEEAKNVTTEGATTSLTLGSDDFGVIIEEGTTRYYYWVANYANHPLTINSLDYSESESDCQIAVFDVDGVGDEMRYYTINGAPKQIDRQITIAYTSLEYDKQAENYVTKEVTDSYEHLTRSIRCRQSLCDTRFTLSGDRFLKAWDGEQSATSSTVSAIAVDAETTATQVNREIDNEQSVTTTTGFGGSAPVEMSFAATVTDAVVFTEWQIARDSEFENPELRYPQQDFDYTFEEYDDFYVRFVAANRDGSCEFTSATYEIQVGESALLCPNAFSPGASPGVNDEWKVSYKSIVEFECHIFNRWGLKMATLTHPSQSWDGKYGGKVVPSGVYYYVIKAVGADGRKYDLSGDINIINYNSGTGGGSSSEPGPTPVE